MSRASDARPRVNRRVNLVMKKYSGENAEDFSLGWTEQSFFFKFSVMGQPNRSLFHCHSPAVGQQHDVLLVPCNFRAEQSCNLLWPFQKVSSTFPLLQRWVRGSWPARPKALLLLLWLVSKCILRGGERCLPSAPSLLQWCSEWRNGLENLPLQPKMSWQLLTQ